MNAEDQVAARNNVLSAISMVICFFGAILATAGPFIEACSFGFIPHSTPAYVAPLIFVGLSIFSAGVVFLIILTFRR
jgi:hypothetical protein